MENITLLKISLIALLSLILTSNQALLAGNLAGANISWISTGKDTFVITLTMYRNCVQSSVGSMSVEVECASTGQTITTLNLKNPSIVDITPKCVSAGCSKCQSSTCSFPYGFSKAVYQTTLILTNAGSCCSILLKCKLPSRMSSITTGGANTSTYLEAYFNRCVYPYDNLPPPLFEPPIFYCVGEDITFNLGYSNIDNDSSGRLLDSFSYEFVAPKTDSQSFVNWVSPYYYDKPVSFWGHPNVNLPFPRGLQFSKSNGDISFRPMKVEQTIMAIKVTEWRSINNKMTKIAETTNEIPIIAISCPNNNNPLLSGPFYKQINAGDSVNFSIYSNDMDVKDTVIIDWSNNIYGSTWSSNNNQVRKASGQFSFKTDSSFAGNLYTFYVRAIDNACPFIGTQSHSYQFQVVKPCIPPINSIVMKDLGCNKYMFYPDSMNTAFTYLWEGVTNDQFTASTNVITRQYADSKFRKIRLTIKYSSLCSKSYEIGFTSDSILQVELPDKVYLGTSDTITIFPKVKNAKGNYKFLWSDGDSVNFNKNVSIKGLKKTYLLITVTDSNGCKAIDSVQIFKNMIIVDLGTDLKKCKFSSVNLSYQIYNFGNSTYISTEWYKVGNAVPFSISQTCQVFDTGSFFVKVSFSGGLVAYDTINISNYPVPFVDAGAPQVICTNVGLFELKGTPAATPQSYWEGTGVEIHNFKYYFNPYTSGICNGCNYYLHYYYVDSIGCKSSDSRSIRVVFSSLKPEIKEVLPQCNFNKPVKLEANIGPGIWTGKGVSNGYFEPFKAGIGSHEIIYRVGNEPCYAYDTIIIKVGQSVDASITTPNNQTAFCKGMGYIPLYASPSGGIFSGDVVNGHFFNADTVDGEYNVYYTVFNTNQCYEFVAKTFTTGESFLKIITEIITDTVFCEGKKIVLNSIIKNVPKRYWSVWDSSDGSFNTVTNAPTIEYQPGMNDLKNKKIKFYLRTNNPNCKFIEDSVMVILADTPEVNFYADPPVYSAPDNAYKVSFYDNSQIYTASAVYKWQFSTSKYSTLKNPVYYYQYAGQYDVALTVTDQNYCIGSNKKYKYITILSVEDNITKSTLSIYPNPSSNTILISSTTEIDKIKLFNSIGKAVFQQSEVNAFEFILPKFEKGIYLLKVIDKQGNIRIEKVVFQ